MSSADGSADGSLSYSTLNKVCNESYMKKYVTWESYVYNYT